MREALICITCGTALTGGLDTYGKQGHEQCLTCFLHGVREGDELELVTVAEDEYEDSLF